MKKTVRILCLLLSVAMLFSCMTACGSKDSDKSSNSSGKATVNDQMFIGEWDVTVDGEHAVYAFAEDGSATVTLDGAEFSLGNWKVENGKLFLQDDGEDDWYSVDCKIEDDKIILSTDGEDDLVLTRKSAEPVASDEPEDNGFESKPEKPDSSNTSILGLWDSRHGDEVLTLNFKANGELFVSEDYEEEDEEANGYWRTNGDKLEVRQAGDEWMALGYQLNGDTLILDYGNYGGNKETFTRR